MTSALLPYWPTLEEVDGCLRTEAETIDEALLLAVHESVTLLRRSAQTSREIPAPEQDLLAELMRPIKDGSAVVVAITGASGVGKSHMVRWLRAQLERHRRRKDLVLITIPKTASLRRVIELVLEPLHGAEYQRLKHDLGRTADAMSAEMAAALLATALAEELVPYYERIAADVQASRLGKEWGPRVNIARHLRTIIRDASVQDAWFKSVLLRIVRSSLGGTIDPADRQFRAEDLVPPLEAGNAIQNLEVHRALQYLASAAGQHRQTAAEILQEVLDPALRTIFRFTETLQQRTVQDVVDDIRKQLLADGKELVLLIEDLAALSGIQQPLLDIMIAESDHQGVRVRAPIRTAVAVTDGFLAGRQTVLTRAREQWVVPSEGLSEDAVVRRLVELTGRYLNAARIGVATLRAEFARRRSDSKDLYSWVPRFEETVDADSADKLRAFGYSEANFSLFPFNRAALQSLAAHSLKSDGQWSFTTRTFITEVLSRTLHQRGAFEQGLFPPADFQSPHVPSQISLSLQYQGRSEAERGRLESALYHWAGNPPRLDAIAPVERAVFDAFALPWPFEASGAAPTSERSSSRVSATARANGVTSTLAPRQEVPSTPPPPPAAPAISAYAHAIESWKHDTRLPQTHAARTRVLLATALQQRIDLGDLALQGHKIESRWFWLPPVTTVSNPSANQLRIDVVPPDKPVPAVVIAGLQALDRWDTNGKRWDYIDGESDYASANAMLEPLEQQILKLLLDEGERDAGVLMAALHQQNLLAGLSSSPHPEDPSIRLLFSAFPEEPPLNDEGLTHLQRRALDARRKAMASRSVLQERLKQYISCFQGTGAKPFAVDTDRIRKGWRATLPDRWSVSLRGREDLTPEATDVLDRLAPEALVGLTNTIATAVHGALPDVAQSFNEDHSRAALRNEMTGCVERSIQLAIWAPGANETQVRSAIEELSTELAEATIVRAMKIPPDDPQLAPLHRLAILSSVPLPRLLQVREAVDILQKFLTAQQKLIQDQTSIDDQLALMQREALLKNLTWMDDDSS